MHVDSRGYASNQNTLLGLTVNNRLNVERVTVYECVGGRIYFVTRIYTKSGTGRRELAREREREGGKLIIIGIKNENNIYFCNFIPTIDSC